MTRRSILPYVPLVLLVLLTPLVIRGVVSARTATANAIHWLPTEWPERAAYDTFVECFGIDDFLLVSWPGCTIDDSRVPCFADDLLLHHGPGNTDGREPLLSGITTAPAAVERLTDAPLRLSRTEAVASMQGFLIGSDGTCGVIVHLTPEGRHNPSRLIEAVRATAARILDGEGDRMYLGGTAFEAHAIDTASLRSLRLFVIPSSVVVAIIAWWCLRDIRVIAIAVVVAGFCQAASVAVVTFCGDALSAVMIVMPSLVYVVALSAAIHLVNYYRDAVQDASPTPALAALQSGWLPCVAASVTTAIGLASLTVSAILPVRLFGFYSAISVMLSMVVVLACVPAALHVFVGRTGQPVLTKQPPLSTWIDRTGGVVTRHAGWISGFVLIVFIMSAYGLVHLKTAVNLQRMFGGDSDLMRNYGWLEEHIGPLIPIEVVMTSADVEDRSLIDRVDMVCAIEESLRTLPEIRATMSAGTHVPSGSERPGERSGFRRIVVNRLLRVQKSKMIEDRLLAEHEGKERWRISAKVSALEGIEYGTLLEKVERVAKEALARHPSASEDGVEVVCTGVTPLVYRAQEQLLLDLVNSFVCAFAIIAPIMMLACGGIVRGLLVMIPNVTPVVVAFGWLGWLGIPIDVGMVLTASVSLGLAVDGTLHFVNWYQHERNSGMDNHAALRSAMRTTGLAMMQSTLICGSGIIVFGLSEFLPTRRFACFLVVSMLCALVADMVQLPAMLAGRCGRWFAPKRRRDGASEASSCSIGA